MASLLLDPVVLAANLIRCHSVTPADDGALGVLQAALEPLGFACTPLPFGEGQDLVHNLFARIGEDTPHFCFAGHSDVVPVGDRDAWTSDPFGGEVRDDFLFGRGAADMKGAIACFAAAVSAVLPEFGGALPGSVSLLITGDEEGPANFGTAKVLEWMAANGHIPDVCLIGEPTNPAALGDALKVGRRGSLVARLAVSGTQGHVAYPATADNPVTRLMAMLASVTQSPLDAGNENFEPSNVEVTSIDVGNPAVNVIPAKATAIFNIRFTDDHSSASLTDWLHGKFAAVGGAYELDVQVSGEAFVTAAGPLTALVAEAVTEVLGRTPALSTAGGTSDGRFIKDYCSLVEFGLVGRTMHGVDECVALADLAALSRIYTVVLHRYFTQ